MRFVSPLALVCLAACSDPAVGAATDTGTTPTDGASDVAADVGPETDPSGCTIDPGAGDTGIDPATYAPLKPEEFTVEKAMAGFPAGTGVIRARITTQLGKIDCVVDTAAAPVSAANFIGLARGTRPYKQGTTWMVGRFYDGLKWHRVVPSFVIQGGDPRGNGTGGPGYSLPVENHVTEPLGTLAMAASTAPNGSQYYIVVDKGPPPNYNVFGLCDTETAIAISKVPADSKAAPVTEVNMQKIDIVRCPK